MSLTINTKTYTADSFQKDQIGYYGPARTLTMKDDLKLSRTAAKPTETFSGMSRVDAKLTRTLTLTGAKTPLGDAIMDVPVAIPVGASAADVDAICNDMGAFISSASFKTFVKSLVINF